MTYAALEKLAEALDEVTELVAELQVELNRERDAVRAAGRRREKAVRFARELRGFRCRRCFTGEPVRLRADSGYPTRQVWYHGAGIEAQPCPAADLLACYPELLE